MVKINYWSEMKKGLLAVVLLWLVSVAETGTVTVYSPAGTIAGNYTTIQEGVDNCLSGGTVSVAAGTWTKVVYINKRIILVEGEVLQR